MDRNFTEGAGDGALSTWAVFLWWKPVRERYELIDGEIIMQHTPGHMSAFESVAYDVWEAVRRSEPLGEIPEWKDVDEAQRQHIMDVLRRTLAQAKGENIRLSVSLAHN